MKHRRRAYCRRHGVARFEFCILWTHTPASLTVRTTTYPALHTVQGTLGSGTGGGGISGAFNKAKQEAGNLLGKGPGSGTCTAIMPR